MCLGNLLQNIAIEELSGYTIKILSNINRTINRKNSSLIYNNIYQQNISSLSPSILTKINFIIVYT
jgi:hypothetical protein